VNALGKKNADYTVLRTHDNARSLVGTKIPGGHMPRALPSDVVKLIDSFFPWAASGSTSGQRLLTFANAPGVSALVELVERLPEDNLQLTGEEYSHAVWAIASLRHVAERLAAGHISAGGGWPVPSFDSEDAITLLRRLLSKCPDEGIRSVTAGLEFVHDEDLRTALRRDISSSESALNSGQWKAATVLAGSVVEALLLWNIKRDGDAERRSALQTTITNLKLAGVPEDWGLDQYIKVTRELGEISQETADQARLAKDFRNLIHPGREVRKRMRCDRGTAHAAFAALNLVIADLERLLAGA
jgi:hypothetical protein